MRAHWSYLRYVLAHKWYVLVACRFWNVPNWLWVGVLHDLSKFFQSEWTPYVRYFYRPDGSPVRRRDENGHYQLPTSDREFNEAWNLHQKRNKHHWQFWTLLKDDGTVLALPIPERYAREMLADWMGAGQAQGHPGTLESMGRWYRANRDKMVLHDTARTWVEQQLRGH